MDRCRLPWSRHLPSGCLECRCNIRHQLMLETSYLVMETHANSTLSKCMLLACAYQSAKENGHCQKKILPRHWTTIWQRGTLWKTLFQNKPSGTINPVYLPRKLLNNTKHVSINKILSITNFAQYFILQLWRNIPLTTMTSIECACSTLAVSLKRWDVEAGTIKRTSQRNKGMAEKHTKPLV